MKNLSIVAAVLAAAGAAAARSAVRPGRTFTPDERREIQEVEDVVRRYQEATGDYSGTLRTLLERAYEQEKGKVGERFDEAIDRAEAVERERRLAAIAVFEEFLRRYPNDTRWSGDAMYRLAELYYERDQDAYLQALDDYEVERRRFDAKEIAEAPREPTKDFSPSIDLYLRLVREFRDYRFLDGALYLLGFCLAEQGREDLALRAYQSVVCPGKFSPPTTLEQVAAGPERPELVAARAADARAGDFYAGCEPLVAGGRHNAEAWTRIGEHHFDNGELLKAVAAYTRVLEQGQDNPLYDKALYKLAWAYYRAAPRDATFLDAIRRFDELVKFADARKEQTGKVGSELRGEAVEYLAISFADEDWDGDGLPDQEGGLTRIDRFYADTGRLGEAHVPEVYLQLADVYFSTDRYADSVAAYRTILKRWPLRRDGPLAQSRIITALERDRKMDEALREREQFSRLFAPGSEWERKHRGDPDAIAEVRELDRKLGYEAAVFHHKGAQELRQQCAAGEAARCALAQQEYRLAAEAYRVYLERFPHAPDAYELAYNLADALYYSQQFLAAAAAFEGVRDSQVDNRFQADAAFAAVKCYEEAIAEAVRGKKLGEPAVPTNTTVKKPVQAMPVPDLYTKYLGGLDTFVELLPADERTPPLAYKGAEIQFRFLQLDEARRRFAAVIERWCQTDLAIEAFKAIVESHLMQDNLADSQEWSQKLAATTCGLDPAKRAQAAQEGVKISAGIRFKNAEDLFAQGKFEEAADLFVKIVNDNPKAEDAPKGLNNAAVAYEKVQRYDAARQLYERLYRDYPDSEFADDAVFRTAVNYYRFFEFDLAVNNYLILVEGRKYRTSEHRDPALIAAAAILEGNHDYARSADLYKKYADVAKTPKEAADAYFRAILVYEKMGDADAMVRAAREFQRRWGRDPEQAGRVVEALYKMAKVHEQRRDARTAETLMRQAVSEFSARRLAPASDAAEWAARASFWLVERDWTGFEKLTIEGEIEDLEKQATRMAERVRELQTAYKDIWKYKRANWTLAAMTREALLYERFAQAYAAGFKGAPISREIKKLKKDVEGAGGDWEAFLEENYYGPMNQKLSETVTPIEEQAKALFKLAVEQAGKLAVSNEWTDLARARLNAYLPSEYPLLKKVKVDLLRD